ncbi:MAG: hypothetical protein ABGY08_05630, partial [Gammaproteobacteria bacterium]
MLNLPKCTAIYWLCTATLATIWQPAYAEQAPTAQLNYSEFIGAVLKHNPSIQKQRLEIGIASSVVLNA